MDFTLMNEQETISVIAEERQKEIMPTAGLLDTELSQTFDSKRTSKNYLDAQDSAASTSRHQFPKIDSLHSLNTKGQGDGLDNIQVNSGVVMLNI